MPTHPDADLSDSQLDYIIDSLERANPDAANAPARDEAGELEAQCRGLIASHGEGVMAPLSARDLLNLLARARLGRAETQRLREALEAVKRLVCGDAHPFWVGRNVTASRLQIANIIDAALAPGGGRDVGTKGAE